MNVSTEIYLDKFKPRDFQMPICHALENLGFKKLLLILPRRAGKDLVCWNLLIRAAIRKPGTYFYMLPSYTHAKLVIWDSCTNSGFKFLDFIPKELIKSTNSQELKITLINGSIIKLLGSDNFDSIVGSNPSFIVMSEYALADPRALQFFRPILNANNGTIIINSTPRGRNHLYDLYQIARESPDWYCCKLTLNETKHISWEEIQKEIDSGEISLELAQQEYLVSFDRGAEGSYYAKYIDKLRVNGQIGKVPWEVSFPVHVVLDIGVRDSTSIIFFQQIGRVIHIIDCYERAKEGLEHYVNVIKNKPYNYGKFWAPHDVAVVEWGSGLSRIEKARELGIKFETRDGGKSSALPNLSIEDGIEACRSAFSKIWFDQDKCAPLIKALENYRQEYDEKRKVYRDRPLHDHNSNYADAFRYLVLSLSRTRDSQSSPEELEQRYRKAQGYGGDGLGVGQGFFNDNHKIW